jgi:transcriptional regulator with XRE-family HTH domain
MDFATIMRQLREHANLTQAELAERAGLPLRTIQGWEQGYRCPVSPAFFKLAKALGASCEAFANFRAPPKGVPGKKKPKK